MPNYVFRNNKTDEVRTVNIPYEDLKNGYNGENGDELDTWEREWTVNSIKTDTCNRF